MPDDPTVTDAIELAERILGEVTRARQDWRAIEHLAASLATLAARARLTPKGPESAGGISDG
jgi:hypothetical protein